MTRLRRTLTGALIVCGAGLLAYEIAWALTSHDGGGTAALGAMLIVGGLLARR